MGVAKIDFFLFFFSPTPLASLPPPPRVLQLSLWHCEHSATAPSDGRPRARTAALLTHQRTARRSAHVLSRSRAPVDEGLGVVEHRLQTMVRSVLLLCFLCGDGGKGWVGAGARSFFVVFF